MVALITLERLMPRTYVRSWEFPCPDYNLASWGSTLRLNGREKAVFDEMLIVRAFEQEFG